MKRFLASLLFAVSIRGESVADAVARATTTEPFNRALWFVLVEEEDGTVVHDLNADLLAIPASVRKLFSAATTVECLGPTAQYDTELWIDGEDVIVRGTGDPSFGSDRYGNDPQSTFAPFVAALRARGLRRVRNVVADVSAFDRVTIPYQWKVGNLTVDYASPVDAIAYDENEVNDNAMPSAGLFAAAAFRDALQRAGISVTGSLRTNVEPRQWQERLAVVRSPFVRHLLTTSLKNSHNLFAEMLFKSVSPQPASYDGARELERELLHDAGIADGEFHFVDGSGLAPDDLVTPSAVVKILRWMNAPARRSLWWDVLAQPAGEGTLRNRLTNIGDRMRGKTGTVAGVNSLAGMVTNREGRTRYFVVIVNHHTGSSSVASKLLDAIAQAAAEF